MKTDNKNLGAELREHRLKNGISLAQAADYFGVSFQTVSDWELHRVPENRVKSVFNYIHGIFRIEFSEKTSAYFVKNDPQATSKNYSVIRTYETYCRHLKDVRGYLFLNEVLKKLGMKECHYGHLTYWGKDDDFEISIHRSPTNGEIILFMAPPKKYTWDTKGVFEC